MPEAASRGPAILGAMETTVQVRAGAGTTAEATTATLARTADTSVLPVTTAVTTAEELTAILGEPTERTRTKVRDRLTVEDRRWLAATPLCFLGTSDAEGRCDVSPKGDPAGSLVHVVDEVTIAIAERPGNRRVDGYHNVLANPHVGIVFVVPGRADTLRVNGRARLVRDAPWFDDLAVRGQRPVLGLVVDVEEVFGHCAKSFVRGRVWHPESWRPELVDEDAAVPLGVAEREDAQIASYASPLY